MTTPSGRAGRVAHDARRRAPARRRRRAGRAPSTSLLPEAMRAASRSADARRLAARQRRRFHRDDRRGGPRPAERGRPRRARPGPAARPPRSPRGSPATSPARQRVERAGSAAIRARMRRRPRPGARRSSRPRSRWPTRRTSSTGSANQRAVLLRISCPPTSSTSTEGTIVSPSSASTSLARNRENGSPRRRSTTQLDDVARQHEHQRDQHHQDAGRERVEHDLGEEVGVHLAPTGRRAGSCATSARDQQRRCRAGSGAGCRGAAGARRRVAATGALRAGSVGRATVCVHRHGITDAPSCSGRYSLAFSRSFSSVMNSPMSRKWR